MRKMSSAPSSGNFLLRFADFLLGSAFSSIITVLGRLQSVELLLLYCVSFGFPAKLDSAANITSFLSYRLYIYSGFIIDIIV